MNLICFRCGASDFRTSRLRLSDARHLLTVQYPLRCKDCKMRRFVPLRLGLRLRRSEARARKASGTRS
jgi:hypothetical protein